MRIAICTFRLTGGGAERVASLWIKGFYDQGHEVSVILGDSYYPITYDKPDDIKLYDVIPHLPTHKLRYLWSNIDKKYKVRALRRIFKEVQPDVVIAVLPSWGPAIYAAKGNMNFKVIGTDHNSYERPADAPMDEYQRWLKFEFNKKFDAVTVLTQADKEYIGDRLTNVNVLPNPLSFTPLSEVPHKKKIILASGRLYSWYVKGLDVLIKAWGAIAAKYPEWELHIAGEGKNEDVQRIQGFIREAECSNSVKLLGFCNNIEQIYRNASIFVLSSRFEGFGMVLTEAMSQGCACIACDYKGRQAEIIRDSQEGIICPIDDIPALYKSIEKMICDDDYRQKVQHQSLVRANDFSITNIMKTWNGIIEHMFS